MKVDGQEVMSMEDLNESPKDAMLGREMKDVFKVKDLMCRAQSQQPLCEPIVCKENPLDRYSLQ